MKDSFVVSVFDGARYLCHQTNRFSPIGSQCGFIFKQAASGSEFHTKKWKTILALAYLVNRKDVWMIQTCSSFATEAHERVVRIRMMTQVSFQCDNPTGVTLSCAIDDTHSTAANLFEDLIIAESPIRVTHIDFIEDTFQRFALVRFLAETAI